MDETSATITVKKVEEKKKEQEEENVEETVQVDMEIEQEEEDEEVVDGEPQTKKGPFDVKLKKTKQNVTIIKVSKLLDRQVLKLHESLKHTSSD